MKRLLALLAGALGLRALLRRRSRRARSRRPPRTCARSSPSRGRVEADREASSPARRRSTRRTSRPARRRARAGAPGDRRAEAELETAANSSPRSASVRRAQRRRGHPPASGRRVRATTAFSAAWRGKRSTVARSCAGSSRVAAPHGLDDHLGKRRREPRDRARRAGGEPLADQRLGADQDVEPLQQVRLHLLERRVAHLHPGDVVDRLAQPLDHRDGDRVARRLLELVDVERQRRARTGGGDEVGEQRVARRTGSTAARSPRPPRRRPRRRARRARPCRPSSARRSARAPAAARATASRDRGASARRARGECPRRSCPSSRTPSTPASRGRVVRRERIDVERRPPSRSGVSAAAIVFGPSRRS